MLRIHTSDDADALVGALAEVLSSTPDDPLTPEVIAVPTRGIERWISQELALRLDAETAGGVAANIAFPSPGRLVADTLIAAHGGEHPADPWRARNLVWPVLDALDAVIDEPWMAVPAHFVNSGSGAGGRRLRAARTIAGLFASYDVEHPDLIQAWASGQDTGPGGAPLGETREWQPRFWRLVRQRVGQPSLAESLDTAIAGIASGKVELDLPGRVCVFGLTAMPIGRLRVLDAIAQQRAVHLFVLHPSQDLWTSVAGLPEVGSEIPERHADSTAAMADHPLLASWGRDARELQAVLTAALTDPVIEHHPVDQPGDEPQHLLVRIQDGVRHNRPIPAPDNREQLHPGDDSIQIHSCHSPTRQVEVLRDAILHLLADDPSLEPRDIIVMCPDVESYAPLIEAAFQPDRPLDGVTPLGSAGIPDIRIRIADRAPASGNLLAALAATIVDLAGGRIAASQVADFVALGPVRRRFRIGDDLVEPIVQLIDDLNISWGLDVSHRASHGLVDRPERTWIAGLERLLAGAAVADRDVELVGSRLPAVGIEGGELDTVSRLTELVARLHTVVETMAEARPAGEWRELLLEATATLGEADPGADWQWRSLEGRLDRLFTTSADQPLSRTDVGALLEPLRQGRATRGNHRTGDLTVCTLMPMRSVPHRVVCLLGMDDGAFPRHPGQVGDDLLAINPQVGTRDPASEDRQLLLDALMAARDHLVVTYSGHDPFTNAPRPPAVPIAELLDTIDVTVHTGDGRPARSQVVIEHPLQPFDARNFTPGGLTPAAVWGFDRDMLRGAEAQLRQQEPASLPLVAEPLPSPLEEFSIEELRRFLEHPVRAFIATKLGFRYFDETEERDDDLPVELDGLARWGIGDRMLRGRLAGHTAKGLLAAEVGRGSLPPGHLADGLLADITGRVDDILAGVAETGLSLPASGTLRVDLTLPDGDRLVGTVPGIAGSDLVTVRYGKIRPKDLLGAYLHLLCATAVDPETSWRAVILGRPDKGDGWAAEELRCIGGDAAERAETARHGLAALVDLYRRGMTEPIPLFLKTSHAYAATPTRGRPMRDAWQGNRWVTGERDDPHHLLAFDGALTLDELQAEPPRSDETGPDWATADSRFAVLALRLWQPIFVACGRDT